MSSYMRMRPSHKHAVCTSVDRANSVQGQPDALRSEFHLSYSMILGLARGQAMLDIEALLAASFRQSQAQNELPALRQRIAALQVTFLCRVFMSSFPSFFFVFLFLG